MKICYLSASEIPSRSANSVHVMKMCDAFSSGGHDVELVARKGEPMKNGNPFSRYGVKNAFPIHFFVWPKIRVLGPVIYVLRAFFQLLRSPAPDLFYSRYIYLVYLASFLKIPCIYEAHVFPGNPAQRLAEILFMRRRTFHRLVVISDALKKDYLVACPKLPLERLLVAHDGANIPSESGSDSFQKDVCGNGDKLKIGYVGQLYPGRGIDIIVQLAPRFPEMEFHVVGGSDEDVRYWKESALFSNLFLHGYVNHGDIGAYYRNFDIALVPYQARLTLEGGKGNTVRWTSPLKIFEYMSYGKAIIASDLPVLREVLKNRENALMVPPEDVEGWACALEELARDKVLMNRLGKAARKVLEEEYTWDKRVARVLRSKHAR
jgi:glycosyltransferase involved in cell wall biosynthesis